MVVEFVRSRSVRAAVIELELGPNVLGAGRVWPLQWTFDKAEVLTGQGDVPDRLVLVDSGSYLYLWDLDDEGATPRDLDLEDVALDPDAKVITISVILSYNHVVENSQTSVFPEDD